MLRCGRKELPKALELDESFGFRGRQRSRERAGKHGERRGDLLSVGSVVERDEGVHLRVWGAII